MAGIDDRAAQQTDGLPIINGDLPAVEDDAWLVSGKPEGIGVAVQGLVIIEAIGLPPFITKPDGIGGAQG